MARDHGSAAEALGEIESAADRLSAWLESNIVWVAAAIVGLLLVAGGVAWWSSASHERELEASGDLAKVRADYLSAMGASAGAIEVPELANPEAAAQIRAEYRERFDAIAEEHPGTVAGAMAALESASLESEAGRTDEAIARLETALAEAPSRPPLRGLLLQQLAQELETAGRWSDAAARHEEASEIGDFPLRDWALADAARCRAQAGEDDGARELYERLEREHPDLDLPAYQRAQRDELRAAAES